MSQSGGEGLERREIAPWGFLSYQRTHRRWSGSWQEGTLLVNESETKGSLVSKKRVFRSGSAPKLLGDIEEVPSPLWSSIFLIL